MLAPSTDGSRAEIGDHTWELRDVEFEDAASVRRYECLACGAVRFE